MPVMGCHSVILNPDSVRRVTPPTTIIANTSVDENNSHRPTPGVAIVGNGAVAPADAFDVKNREESLRAADCKGVGATDE
jgi:hypothetical protein